MRQITLTGVWELRQVGGARQVKAQVPGDIHSALLAAKVIPDPYWGIQELKVQWVGREDWEYRRTFAVDADFLREESVCLNCDSLDTLADVYLNGTKVGAGENMFVRQRFEVKHALRQGQNEIRVVIHSAEQAAAAAAKKLPYPVPCGGAPVHSPHRNLIRKVQCHSGWDWNLCLMVGGIAGNIYLAATSLGRIEHVYTTQHHRRGACDVEVVCEVESPHGGETSYEVALACGTPHVSLGTEKVSRKVRLTPGLNTLKTRLTVRQPELWWPNGHGRQPLYALTVRVAGDEVHKKLGLRTLELINRRDKTGLTMTFRVNGRDIFCKGANWIPAEALPQRQTRARIDDLLTSAVRANMNMLRVWGGGQYESDAFYELCDEKGLLVWQDFMFSCALYPGTPEFLANVRREAVYQVKRLRDHACVALWCGNNEDAGALNWFEEARKNRDRYLLDYDHLTEGVLGKTVEECDSTRTFWPSSPCAGRNDFSDCWREDSKGDMHYWDVWHGGKPFEAFHTVKPRFCSEFGYQSFPSLETIKSYSPRDQWNVTAPVLEHHQRSPGGNTRIVEMFARYFRMPEGLANFVYLSQVQQAVAIQTAIEYWRCLQPYCMGTLYWQLNDTWPVCSWSSLEHSGKWKLLHYVAKRSFRPLLLTAIQQDGNTTTCGIPHAVEIWLAHDLPARRDVRGTARRRPVKITLRVLDFAGKMLRRERFAITAPQGGARLVKRYALAELAPQPEAAFMVLTMQSGRETFQREHFFCAWKQINLPQARVKTVVAPLSDGCFAVTLSTNKPAFFVSANVDGVPGEFDDNCFALLPGESRRIVFTPKGRITAAQVRKALSVRHLRQTYA